MKKTLKLLLIGIILFAVSFAMTGCGKEDKDTKSNKKEENTEVVNTITNDNNNTVNDNNNKKSTAPTTDGWNGNAYGNVFLGVTFNMPSSWIKEDDSNLSSQMTMMAQDPTTGDNVIVQFEDLPTGASAELIYDNLKAGLEAMTEMNYNVGELKTETLAGVTYKSVTATVSYAGIDMVQKYYILVNGNKAGYIIITVTDSSRLNTVISYFE